MTFLRRTLLVALGLVLLAVIVVAASVLTLRTERGQRWATPTLLRLVAPTSGTLTVGALRTDLWSSLRLEDVRLRDDTGKELFGFDVLQADFDLSELYRGVVRVHHLRGEGLRADAQLGDKGLDIANLWGAPAPGPSVPYAGLGIDLLLEDIELAGSSLRLRTESLRYALEDPRLSGSLGFEDDAISIRGLTFDAELSSPQRAAVSLRVDAGWDPRSIRLDTVELDVGPNYASMSGELDGAGDERGAAIHLHALHVETSSLPWALPVFGPFDIEALLSGTTDAPILSAVVATPGGVVTVQASGDLGPERPTWTATVAGWEIALDQMVRGAPVTEFDAQITVAGVGTAWPDDVEAEGAVTMTAPVLGPLGASTLDAVVFLVDGVAWITELRAATTTAVLDADARLDLVASHGSATVRTLDVDLSDLPRFGVSGLAGKGRVIGVASADWSGAEPAAGFVGSVDARGLRYGSMGGIRWLHGPVELDWQDGSGRYAGRFAASRLMASGASLRRGDVDLRGSVTGEGALRLRGTAVATELVVGVASVAALEGRLRLNRTPRGTIDMDAGFDTTSVAAGPVVGDRASGHASLSGGELVATVDLLDGVRTVVGIDLGGHLDTGYFELSRLILSLVEGEIWTGEGTQTATFVGGGVEGLRVFLRSGDASIAASGRILPGVDVALTGTVVEFPLHVLGDVAPGLAGVGGTLGVEARAGGRWDDLTFTTRAAVRGLAVPGAVRGVDVVASAAGGGGDVRVGAAASADGGALATLRGRLPGSLDLNHLALRKEGEVELALVLAPGTSERWSDALDLGDLPRMRGAATVTLAGTPVRPQVTVVGTVEVPAVEAEAEWLGTQLEASLTGRDLRLRAEVRQGERPLAELSGSAQAYLDGFARSWFDGGPRRDASDPAAWLSDLDVTLVAPALPIRTIAAFVAVPEGIEGRLDATARLQGSPLAPVLEAALAVEGAALDGVVVSPATMVVAPANGGYDLDVDLGVGAEGVLSVRGFVPFVLGPSMGPEELDRLGLDLTLTGRAVPLKALAAVLPDIEDASGLLKAEGTVSGSVNAPVLDLDASIVDARFRLASTGVVYDQVGLTVSVTPTRLDVGEVHVRTSLPGTDPDRGAQGLIAGSLAAELDGVKLTRWSGGVTLSHALVSALPSRHIRLESGELTLHGTPPNVTILGAMTIEEAAIHLDERFFSGEADVALPAWLRVHRRGNTLPDRPAAVVTTAVPEWLDARVGIDLGRNTFLRAELPLDPSLGDVLGSFATVAVATQAEGALEIATDGGNLSIVGQVVPIRGTTTVFGKPFVIQDDSRITFTGRDYASPVLDLHAAFDTRGYGPVEARIRGTPEALDVELTAAEYPSQDDVISLLLVGKPASEVTAGEGAGQGASSAAISMLMTSIGQRLGREGAVAAGSILVPDLILVGDQSVEVGKRIGRHIFVLAELDNTADDVTKSYLTVTVEIALGGPWHAELRHGTAGEDAIGVNWSTRY